MRAIFLILSLTGILACRNPNAKLIESAPFLSRTFKDDLGRELSFRDTPRRAIALAPSITEMVFAAGAGAYLAGRSQASNFPKEAQNLPEVISFPEPDFETFVVLDPDLVIATDEVLPPRYLPSFERLNLPVFFQHYDSLGDIFRNMRIIGEIFGTQAVANRMADSLEKACNLIGVLTQNEIHYPSFILISVEPLIVAGGKSYLNQLLDKAGAKNIFASSGEKYPKVTAEAILAGNPEYIFIPDGQGQLYTELINHYPQLARMQAAGTGQVFALDPDLILRPGPRTLQGLITLTKVLHPRVDIPFPADEK